MNEIKKKEKELLRDKATGDEQRIQKARDELRQALRKK